MTITEQITQKLTYIQRCEMTMQTLNPESDAYKALEKSVKQAVEKITELQGYAFQRKPDSASFENWLVEQNVKFSERFINVPTPAYVNEMAYAASLELGLEIGVDFAQGEVA